ncbi:MAG: sigma-70 family RNA polymerase sigma factor [Candidatus Poribacteria bacterium]|nr:sigma-70 family RNA polymerase sigma factor [Candidatus Poribacteria bacterium]
MNDGIVRQAFQAYGYGSGGWERLYRYIRNRVSSDEDAKDIAQETLTQAWKNRSRLRNVSQLEIWLFWIAKNRIIDFHRSKRRRVEQTMDPVQLAEVRDAREWAEPEDPFALETLNRLRGEDRTLAELRFVYDYALAEIAEALKMPIGTVKRKVSEVKARLKELYEAEEAAYAKERTGAERRIEPKLDRIDSNMPSQPMKEKTMAKKKKNLDAARMKVGLQTSSLKAERHSIHSIRILSDDATLESDSILDCVILWDVQSGQRPKPKIGLSISVQKKVD